MEDCFKDLESWTQDIKVKEKKVLEDPSILKTSNKVSFKACATTNLSIKKHYKNINQGLPPIRSLAPAKKKKVKKVDAKKEEKKPTKKLNSYDYRAWDKLDVV